MHYKVVNTMQQNGTQPQRMIHPMCVYVCVGLVGHVCVYVCTCVCVCVCVCVCFSEISTKKVGKKMDLTDLR